MDKAAPLNMINGRKRIIPEETWRLGSDTDNKTKNNLINNNNIKVL